MCHNYFGIIDFVRELVKRHFYIVAMYGSVSFNNH
jgi:hypothetical protein